MKSSNIEHYPAREFLANSKNLIVQHRQMKFGRDLVPKVLFFFVKIVHTLCLDQMRGSGETKLQQSVVGGRSRLGVAGKS